MSEIIFEKLGIYDLNERTAKSVDFMPGVNIITSSQGDGSDRGKSLILRSLYHCMGADALFDDAWKYGNHAYTLDFSFDKHPYAMLRHGTRFTLFDKKSEKAGTVEKPIFSTNRRGELGQRFQELFDFGIWLTARNSDNVEIAPPVYSFCPYYLDQKVSGQGKCDFRSFDNLGQFSSFKAPLIYCFTGAYDETYFTLNKQKSVLNAQINEIKQELERSVGLLSYVESELGGLGFTPGNETMRNECHGHEKEYAGLVEELTKTRKVLLALREDRAEIQSAINVLKNFSSKMEKGHKQINAGTCPLCKHELEDEISVRVEACLVEDDAVFLASELAEELCSVEKRIQNAEDDYKRNQYKLDILTVNYMESIEAHKTTLQIEGLSQVRSKLIDSRSELLQHQDRFIQDKIDIDRKIRRYREDQREVDSLFRNRMSDGIDALRLQVDSSLIKNVSSGLSAAGSDAPTLIILWMSTLLELKKELNPGRTSLPVVLDSPLNVEKDDGKRDGQYGLIFERLGVEGQLILSGLGLEDYDALPKGANIEVLTNSKRRLLTPEGYEEYGRTLLARMRATEEYLTDNIESS